MGTLSAMDMAEHAPLDAALVWHLQSNHFPPVDPVFIPVAKQAIDAGVDAILHDDSTAYDEVVTMPNGIEKSLGEIVEGLHLESFIDVEAQRHLDSEE